MGGMSQAPDRALLGCPVLWHLPGVSVELAALLILWEWVPECLTVLRRLPVPPWNQLHRPALAAPIPRARPAPSYAN